MKTPINLLIFSLCTVMFIVITIDMTAAGNYPLYPLHSGLDSNTNSTYDDPNVRTIDHHSAESKLLKRNKRWYLLWTGISKIVLGFLMPVETKDRVNWRTLNMAHNFQAQFQVLPSIIWPWKVFARSLKDQRRKFDSHGTFEPDETRSFVYNALEMYLAYKRANGRQCLLKAICEIARQPIDQRTIFDDVVHSVLTPNKNEVEDFYLDAKHAGGFGADCAELYPKCLAGNGLLDRISYYF